MHFIIFRVNNMTDSSWISYFVWGISIFIVPHFLNLPTICNYPTGPLPYAHPSAARFSRSCPSRLTFTYHGRTWRARFATLRKFFGGEASKNEKRHRLGFRIVAFHIIDRRLPWETESMRETVHRRSIIRLYFEERGCMFSFSFELMNGTRVWRFCTRGPSQISVHFLILPLIILAQFSRTYFFLSTYIYLHTYLHA